MLRVPVYASLFWNRAGYCVNKLHEAESLRIQSLFSYSRNVQHFVDPGSSLLPLVSILAQINPIHALPSYLFKIHFHIIHQFLCNLQNYF
jgi:hypothetical protein